MKNFVLAGELEELVEAAEIAYADQINRNEESAVRLLMTVLDTIWEKTGLPNFTVYYAIRFFKNLGTEIPWDRETMLEYIKK